MMKKDTFDSVAAEHARELEAMRQRTAQLRQLRLAQEKRGKVVKKVGNARVAKSATQGMSSDWPAGRGKSGQKR
jgi:hypothetical protein